MLISHRRILFCTLSLILTSSYLAVAAFKIPSVNDTNFSATNNATASGLQVQKFNNKPFSTTAISKRENSEARETRWTYFYVGM